MTKKRVVYNLAVVLIAVLSIYIMRSFDERPLIKTPYTVDKLEYDVKRDDSGWIIAKGATGVSGNYDAVSIFSVQYNGEDVTEKIDVEVLAKVFSSVMIKRTLQNYFPCFRSDISWEIDMYYNHKSMQILLGNFNICYDISNKRTYEIINPEVIKQTLMMMVDK